MIPGSLLAAFRGRRWTRRSAPWVGALLIGGIVALAAFDVVRAYRTRIDETHRELETHARVIAEQTARSVQAVDVVLRHLAVQFHHGPLAALSPRDLHQHLREQAVGLAQTDGLAIHHANGTARAVSWLHPLNEDDVNIAKLPGFLKARDDPKAGLVIGSAIRSRSDGHWVIPIGRRLETPSGEFAGTAGARGRIDYFQDFYRDIRPEPGTTIMLLRQDGSVLARYPADESVLGSRVEGFDEMLAQAAARPEPVRVRNPDDGIERLATVRRVPDYPLAVVVSRDVAVAMAPWRAHVVGTATRTLALAAFAALLLAALMRQLSRLYKTRESLEASQERFALAVAGSDDGIWDWDFRSRSVFASARAREILGLPPGPEHQTMDEWFAALRFHPDDLQRRSEAMRAHMSGRTPAYEGDFRVRHADGTYRWVHIRGLCVRDAKGAPQRMAGSVTDIDARKRAEEALRESEERYRVAMTGSNEGHWVWNVVTDELFLSPTLKTIYGLAPDAPVPTRAAFFELGLVHPDDVDPLARAVEAHLAGETERLHLEYRVRLPGSGELRWIDSRGQCFRDAQGEPLRVAGSTIDVTERKRTEQALRESEQQKALAVAASNDGILYWDVVNDRMFASERARLISGVDPQAPVRTRGDWVALLKFHPDDAQRADDDMQANYDGLTSTRDGEYRVLHPDGQYRWVRVRGVFERDADGRPLRWGGSVSDIDDRKRAEEALRQSEQRYALAMTGSNEAHWVWDLATDELYASPMLRELFGISPEEDLPTHRAFAKRIPVHPDDRERVRQAVSEHIAGLTPRIDVEYRIVDSRNCDVRWIHTRAQCFRDAAGKPQTIGGATIDNTARKRAEEQLRESEERFALAVAGANEGILDWDMRDDLMFVSERATDILGLPASSARLKPREWLALLNPRIHPEDAERLRADLRERESLKADLHEGEYRIRHDDGRYRWVLFRGMQQRDEHGRAIRWTGSVSDIDRRRRAEEALRESEQRYQLAVDGSNEGLWDWYLIGDLLYLSPRCQEILWVEPGKPLRSRREWIELTQYHPDDVQKVRDAISAHLRGDTKHFEVEYRLRHHSGAWHWYRQRGIALRDEHGKPYRMAGSMEDITDRKNAEADRDRLERQLRQSQKLEAMGTLAGGIAHDFNNILAAILGYGEMAQKDASPGTPLRRHIDAALSAALRAKSLVERILAFSRSGVGERVPVHVQSVVAEALDVVAASLPRGVQLERKIDCDDAGVLGDPTQIHQVVLNLCANGAQAMRSHGLLSVSVETIDLDEPRTVATSVLAAGRYVRLIVRDSGAGIAPQVLERIFDPFFTTKQVGVGTGLGLSLVHGIVADLGGGIDVDSRIHHGSTFTVYMPFHGRVAPPAVVEEALASGGGETILLVDDEEPLVRLGEEMLAELGYEPVGFASSRAALETFEAAPERFSAILSDEAMPEMTGSEFARKIRAIDPEIPIVLMSGYVSAGLSARAREAGVIEVLAKPLVSRDIARSLASALRRE